MTDTIDYFFTCGSPFAYLGHRTLMDIANRHGKTIRFRPFNIFAVWEQSGSVPLGQRSEVRKRYRLIELQRIAEFRNTQLNPSPKFFPTDTSLADKCIATVSDEGHDPAEFAFSLGQAMWAQDHDLAEEEVIRNLLESAGLEGDAIIEKAKSEAIGKLLEANSTAAINADAIGAPSYVYDGEVFWGQDRLEYLDAMIASGRPSFSTG